MLFIPLGSFLYRSSVFPQSSRNTVDFEEVVVKDEADEGVAESAGPPPGRLRKKILSV